MHKYLLIILSLFSFSSVFPQELRCNVQIVTQQIQGTNKQVFETLQGAIYEFMNNRPWTGIKFEADERIECNMLINLKDQVGADEFRGTLQLQVRRPVFNTSYNTVLLNLVDNDIQFKYVEYQPLEFSESSHLSNLTSILAYYAYIIIGFDFDSFSPRGGTPYFQMAEKIVSNAQNAPEKGWRAVESSSRKNRYWLINGIQDEEYAPIRDFMYKYHRQGLDNMYDQSDKARAEIAEQLKLLQKVYRQKPDPFMYLLQVVIEAKSDELVSIFKESFQDEKTRVYALLTEIDPSHGDKYEQIIK